jgi:hypothetical protein
MTIKFVPLLSRAIRQRKHNLDVLLIILLELTHEECRLCDLDLSDMPHAGTNKSAMLVDQLFLRFI